MKISYEKYLDKVYGCWLGKCVIGTLGAPYEGMKQENHLTFDKKMIEEMLPNDDLDLQVLWLSVLEEKGINTTSEDLAKCFFEKNIKWPGEYAYFRKNYARGIRPPYCGIYENEFYNEGMGCPIRAEIWGMIMPLNPDIASSLSEMDGVLDHQGNSVWFEKFWAGMISTAFEESDIIKLIEKNKKYLPQDSKALHLVEDTVKWCEETDDIIAIRSRIIGKYGHSDCTNSFQNIGFTIVCLLKSGGNPLQAGVIACNLGFDTDCTAGNSGALLGLILGAKTLEEKYGITDCGYKLTLKYARKTDRVYDLAVDTTKVGLHFLNNYKGAENVVAEVEFKDEIKDGKIDEITLTNYYLDEPYFGLNESVRVKIEIKNNTESLKKVKLKVTCPKGTQCKTDCGEFTLKANGIQDCLLTVKYVDKEEIRQTNIFSVEAESGNETFVRTFGVIGKRVSYFYGPFWENNVTLNLEENQYDYGSLITGKDVNERVDNLRCYQLNMVVDTQKEYMTLDEISGLKEDRLYERTPKQVFIKSDTFDVSEFSDFKGPAVYYVKQVYNLPERKRVCLFSGHNDVYEFYIDKKKMIFSDVAENWTPENKHYYHFYLDEGKHEFIYKIVATSGNARVGVILNIDDETGQYQYTNCSTVIEKVEKTFWEKK